MEDGGLEPYCGKHSIMAEVNACMEYVKIFCIGRAVLAINLGLIGRLRLATVLWMLVSIF